MIIKFIEDVKLFHDKFGLETPPAFTKLPDDLHSFRTKFFEEELGEFTQAVNEADLETVADSLVDLIYIISGASLLHGIKPQRLETTVMSIGSFFQYSGIVYPLRPSNELKPIALPSREEALMFEKHMRQAIDAYNTLHADVNGVLESHQEGFNEVILASMALSCLNMADECGLHEEVWLELWNDVQRANMSKVRAQKAADSKRGSQWDVVKPAGWVGPQTKQVLDKWIAHAQGNR